MAHTGTCLGTAGSHPALAVTSQQQGQLSEPAPQVPTAPRLQKCWRCSALPQTPPQNSHLSTGSAQTFVHQFKPRC